MLRQFGWGNRALDASLTRSLAALSLLASPASLGFCLSAAAAPQRF